MYSYHAYGLGIYSSLPLFNLPVKQDVREDVFIDVDAIEVITGMGTEVYPYEKLSSQEAVFNISGVGRFQVLEGSKINIDPALESNQWQVQRYLLGPAMAILLYQRDRLVLHASAISLNGKGVAFLGDSGAGKSSIAAAFLAHGYKLLVDDLVSINIDAGTAWVDPGFPYIKLSHEAINVIDLNPEQLESMDLVDGKVSYRIDHLAHGERVLLKAIYIILPGEEVNLERFNSQQALFELMRYSIPVSMVKLNHVAHFERCVELVNCVGVYGLRRPESLTHLSQLVEKVEENT